LLRLTGHETLTAYDGKQAVAAAASFRPDVVLLDIGLPQANGYDVARQLRTQSWGRGTLLIALTGWGQEEDRRLPVAGCRLDAHIVKPVDHAYLVRLLAGLAAMRTQSGSDASTEVVH
jgi:CheY-like chemotaxis protein